MQYTVKLHEVKWTVDSASRIKGIFTVDPYQGRTGATRTDVIFRNIKACLERGLRLGDTIVLEIDKSAYGMLREVVKVNESGEVLSYPKQCPCCGEGLRQRSKNGPPQCNNRKCTSLALHRFKHFAKSVGIPFSCIRNKIVEKMITENPKGDIELYYTLPIEFWLMKPRWSQAQLKQLYEYIHRTKETTTLYQLLRGLHCPLATAKNKELIDSRWKTVGELYNECFMLHLKEEVFTKYSNLVLRKWFLDPIIRRQIRALNRAGMTCAEVTFGQDKIRSWGCKQDATSEM